MSGTPRENNGNGELEFANSVLQTERRQMGEHIRLLEKRCAELEKKLADMSESRTFRLARKLLDLNDRTAFLLKKAVLALTPMGRCARLRRTERLLRQYRHLLPDREPERSILRRRELRSSCCWSRGRTAFTGGYSPARGSSRRRGAPAGRRRSTSRRGRRAANICCFWTARRRCSPAGSTNWPRRCTVIRTPGRSARS